MISWPNTAIGKYKVARQRDLWNRKEREAKKARQSAIRQALLVQGSAFFRNGQKQALAKRLGIKRLRLWYDLRDIYRELGLDPVKFAWARERKGKIYFRDGTLVPPNPFV